MQKTSAVCCLCLVLTGCGSRWERDNRNAIMALAKDVQTQYDIGQYEQARASYRALTTLVAGHELRNTALRSAVCRARELDEKCQSELDRLERERIARQEAAEEAARSRSGPEKFKDFLDVFGKAVELYNETRYGKEKYKQRSSSSSRNKDATRERRSGGRGYVGSRSERQSSKSSRGRSRACKPYRKRD